MYLEGNEKVRDLDESWRDLDKSWHDQENLDRFSCYVYKSSQICLNHGVTSTNCPVIEMFSRGCSAVAKNFLPANRRAVDC